MSLTHFYYTLGMLMVIVPLAATFAILVSSVIQQIRLKRPLQGRPLLLLCLVALIPALGGIALLRFAAS